MRRLLFFVLFGGLILPPWAAGPAQAQSKEEREVRALIDESVQAANSVDPKIIERNFANYSGSGGPFYHPFVASLATPAEVRALENQVMPQMASHSYAITGPVELRVDKNLAWAAFTWHGEVAFKDGTRRSFDGRSTTTFAREGKYWKIAHWHVSLPAPFPSTKAVLDAEAQKIIGIERAAWDALKNKQPERLNDYYTDDASLFDDSLAYRVQGKSEILRGLQSWMDSTELRSYQILEPQAQVLGDTAVLTYYFNLSAVRAGKEFSQAGKVTLVLVRQGGEWRALHEHLSVNH